MIWWQVSLIAIYSASVEDKATVFCFLLTQDTAPPASNIANPVTDLHDILSPAQSASANAINPSFNAPLYVIFALRVQETYWTIYNAHYICSSEGFAENCNMLITAYAISGLVPSARYNKDPIIDW